MPGATVVQGEATQGEIPVDDRPVVYGIGRNRTTVQVIGREVDGRRFIRVMRGPSAGCTYFLPTDELFVPDVQPCVTIPPINLPHDTWERIVDDPDSPTCPHTLTTNKELTYDEHLGCWVHAEVDCRRPQAAHLRTVAGADGGFR